MQEFFNQGDLISVLTTQPIDRCLDYKAPEEGCFTGAFLEVPLGPRKVLGVVWGPGQGDFDITKIRPALRVLDVAPMRSELKSFKTIYFLQKSCFLLTLDDVKKAVFLRKVERGFACICNPSALGDDLSVTPWCSLCAVFSSEA